jgi:HSP20 family molecular chaperone IbpA
LNYSGGDWDGIRTFTRTVWLPHRIDSNAVKASLDHGVLTVTAPKAKDETISINVE